MDNRIKLNKLVGRIDGEYYFVEDVFDHGDNFKGATGHILLPMDKAGYDQATDVDTLRDSLKEVWQMAVEGDRTEDGLNDFVDQAIASDGVEELAFDTSGFYGTDWEVMRGLGFSEAEYPVFVWGGCGRIFSQGMKFDEVYDQAALDKVNEYEAK